MNNNPSATGAGVLECPSCGRQSAFTLRFEMTFDDFGPRIFPTDPLNWLLETHAPDCELVSAGLARVEHQQSIVDGL